VAGVTSGRRGPALISPAQMGSANRARVLRALADHGPLSRAELARLAGVTRATMGTIVQSLLDADVVEELELERQPGQLGRTGRRLWFAQGAGRTVAVELGTDGVRAASIDARGEVDKRSRAELPASRSADAIVRSVVRVVSKVAGGDSVAVAGVGIAVPGACDAAGREVITSASLPALPGSGLVAKVEAATGLPAYVENNARADALAEQWFGLGRSTNSFAVLHAADGLGLGIVSDGVVLRPGNGRGGELGHTYVGGTVRCQCGLRGCWEAHAGRAWLRSEAASLRIRGAAEATLGTAAEGVQSPGPPAKLADRLAERLSWGLATIVQLFAPDLIVLSGDLAGAPEAFAATVEAHTKARSLPHLADSVRVRASSLGSSGALLGASALVLTQSFRTTV
jgi:predicted NBD/HSP70 family sugar kinase